MGRDYNKSVAYYGNSRHRQLEESLSRAVPAVIGRVGYDQFQSIDVGARHYREWRGIGLDRKPEFRLLELGHRLRAEVHYDK